MVPMPPSTALSDGKGPNSTGSAGVSCPFMVDPECVSAVSAFQPPTSYKRCLLEYLFAEEFALIEASYCLVRVLQAFPNLRLPPQEPREPTGQEKQSLTIVVSSAEGCRVLLD